METLKIHPGSAGYQEMEAEKLRKDLDRRGVLYINLLSSPGSGKTSLLSALLERLSEEFTIGVMEADIEGHMDADRLEKAGYRTIQLQTDSVHYLDATMSRQGLMALGLEGLDAVFLENVGSLVRPVGMDSGAHEDVLIFSIPEGMDKPLKYPLTFQKSDMLVLNKMDVLPFFDFDLERFKASVRILNSSIPIIETSVKTGQGIDELAAWVRSKILACKARQS